jgi:predicted regulator of Ras-like GTPase activity (Roadblock/LC7/MglB family)
MSNIVKSKFVGLLRGLLRRFDNSGATMVAPPRRLGATAASRTTLPRASSHSKTQPIFARTSAAPAADPGALQLPLPSVIAGLPMDLRAKLIQTPPADAFVSIPVEKILSQLARGSVKISFGELCTALPGLFVNSGGANDARQIALPLNEIISRINPALLSRRAVNKVEPADDVAGPFGTRSQDVNFTAAHAPAKAVPMSPPKAPRLASTPAAAKSVTPPPAVVPQTKAAASRPARIAPIRVAPAAPAAGSFNSAPQIPVANSILAPMSALAEKWPDAIKMELIQTDLMNAHAALPAALIETGLKRGRVTILWKNLRMMILPKPAPVSVHDGVEVELALKALAPLYFASQKAAGQARKKVSVSAEIPDLFHSSEQAEAAITPTPAPACAPAPKPAPVSPISATPADPEQKIISAPLAALAEKWPEALRQEITEWNLANAQVALSLNALAPAMKRGRVTFAWRDLRSWIRPTPAAAASVHDSAELELPLKVIAPLFLEQQTTPARKQSRLTIDQSIPSPFSGFASAETKAPVTAPPAAPVTELGRPALKPAESKSPETNFYVWGDGTHTPREDESEYKRPQAPETDFTSRYATPKEIVARAMALPGVAGVVVALCDGLMIACQVPPELNADTVAAFLPQIFDRVAQSTRELRMGALNNLKFTVGNVPWHIFRVNAVYFAAFGRAGESMPTAQLASLAGELDRKKQ